MPTAQEIINILHLHYKPNDILACSLWNTEDVLERARDIGILKFSEEEAQEVLFRVHYKMDASIGINWDMLDYYITEVWQENHIQNRKENEVDEVTKTETGRGVGEVGGEGWIV